MVIINAIAILLSLLLVFLSFLLLNRSFTFIRIEVSKRNFLKLFIPFYLLSINALALIIETNTEFIWLIRFFSSCFVLISAFLLVNSLAKRTKLQHKNKMIEEEYVKPWLLDKPQSNLIYSINSYYVGKNIRADVVFRIDKVNFSDDYFEDIRKQLNEHRVNLFIREPIQNEKQRSSK